jgi:hypothetical protein
MNGSDIVTAGTVLILKRNGLALGHADNTYINGRLYHQRSSLPFAESTTLGAGEKVWVTKIIVNQGGAFFELLADPSANPRYSAGVLFPFPLGPIPSPDEVERTVNELFGVVLAEAPAPFTNAPRPPAASDLTPPPAPPMVPPPPPVVPAASSKVVRRGMSIDEVVAVLGQPNRIADEGAKKIYIYEDLELIFVNGKVTEFR